ncbi:MAG: hypothetical protein JSV91_13965 [Phycisphaerales bacterium]|nr:MAG: hypothetical protein JSV91_13965 [Phycisphaerales bacterium]
MARSSPGGSRTSEIYARRGCGESEVPVGCPSNACDNVVIDEVIEYITTPRMRLDLSQSIGWPH